MEQTTAATDVNIDNLLSTAGYFMREADRNATGTNTLDVLRSIRKAERNLEAAKQATVDRARMLGATWSEIAGVLGISKQAAQQRYGR